MRAAVPGNALWAQAFWSAIARAVGQLQRSVEVRHLGGPALLRALGRRCHRPAPQAGPICRGPSALPGIRIFLFSMRPAAARSDRDPPGRQPAHDLAGIRHRSDGRAGLLVLETADGNDGARDGRRDPCPRRRGRRGSRRVSGGVSEEEANSRERSRLARSRHEPPPAGSSTRCRARARSSLVFDPRTALRATVCGAEMRRGRRRRQTARAPGATSRVPVFYARARSVRTRRARPRRRLSPARSLAPAARGGPSTGSRFSDSLRAFRT